MIVQPLTTGVSELRNIGYMVRLGLWGPGSGAFPELGDLLQAVASRGVGALELVAMDMKARFGLLHWA